MTRAQLLIVFRTFLTPLNAIHHCRQYIINRVFYINQVCPYCHIDPSIDEKIKYKQSKRVKRSNAALYIRRSSSNSVAL